MEQTVKFYPYTNENFKYVGVWQESDGFLKSYWNRSVAEIGFTGNTVEIHGTSAGTMVIFLDDAEVSRDVLTDGCRISVSAGEHVLKIVTGWESELAFEGISIPAVERVYRTADKPYLQFIGDSITYACPGFSYTTGENLNVDYSIRAYCGMSLKEGWGWYAVKDGKVRPGMETMYYKLEDPIETDEYTDYRFEFCRTPEALVIFLGTNDYLDTPDDEAAGNIGTFAETYDRFVSELARRYPEARIFLFQALSDKHCRREGIRCAYERMATHLPRVELIPTDTWNAGISADGTHPSPKGYATLAEKLTDYLKEKMGW